MGQKQNPSDKSTQQVRTPTSDDRMDANDKDAKQKDLDQHQAGHQQTGNATGKQSNRRLAGQQRPSATTDQRASAPSVQKHGS